MCFVKKWGEPGWPRPQGERLERWCERWQVDYTYTIAETGSRYYTLYGADGAWLQVRIADHNNVYGRVDISWDPDNDAWPEIRQWIQIHGVRPRRWGQRLAQQLIRKLQAVLPQYVVELMPGIDEPFIMITDTQQLILAQISRDGLRLEEACPANARDILIQSVPAQYQMG